jgi:hypothetical protein
MCANGERKVSFLTRRPLGSGEGKTGSKDWRDQPELRKRLCGLRTPAERDALLRSEGDRGTIPPWELRRIEELIAAGHVEHRLCGIAHAIPSDRDVEVVLDSGEVLRAGQLAIATGFTAETQDWLLASARMLDLPFYPDGIPLLEANFEWGKGSGIYMTGIHARRVAGPFAHNLVGAQMLAEVLCDECS